MINGRILRVNGHKIVQKHKLRQVIRQYNRNKKADTICIGFT